MSRLLSCISHAFSVTRTRRLQKVSITFRVSTYHYQGVKGVFTEAHETSVLRSALQKKDANGRNKIIIYLPLGTIKFLFVSVKKKKNNCLKKYEITFLSENTGLRQIINILKIKAYILVKQRAKHTISEPFISKHLCLENSNYIQRSSMMYLDMTFVLALRVQSVISAV